MQINNKVEKYYKKLGTNAIPKQLSRSVNFMLNLLVKKKKEKRQVPRRYFSLRHRAQ